MRRTHRYLTHPQVLIDPETPVPEWSLNELGKRRVNALSKSRVLVGTNVVVSSAEKKAIETASPLAEALECPLEIREYMHENDRSATGFLQPDEFETVADQFFANPDQSVQGWESAQSAQSRIVVEVRECLRNHPDGDILFVGHGGVGTLLFCYLSGYPIDREYDQGNGGGGCFFEFSGFESKPRSHWQPLENLID